MAKNLVVCCDGTNNEFGAANTNVVRTYSVATKQEDTQIAYYAPGVGTFPATGAILPITQTATKIAGSAAGYGLSDNVFCSYKFLMENYQEGDRIYLFGFSRGAYTARVIAALVHACGLLNPYSDNLISYAWNLFRDESSKNGGKQNQILSLPVCTKFKETFSRAAPIHFIGVWDTVSSVGQVYNPFKLPYTKTNPSVEIVRHAISIDERRKFFRTNLWSNPSPQNKTDVIQVWFAGAHADVGGGYPEAEGGLSKISLQWMIDEARTAGMGIDASKIPAVLMPAGYTPPPEPPSPTAKMHNELDKPSWKAAQLIPREHSQQDPKSHQWTTSMNWSPAQKPRFIADGSRVHHTVFDRMKADTTYRPVNVPKDVCDETAAKVTW
ncbi:MAG TPA: DUF2235 domain-containing protein [Gammaproteobacteria bacterium]|jgi:uncharacterized protein (DUF2235 family)